MHFLKTVIVLLLFYGVLCDTTAQYDEDLARKMLAMSAASYSTTPQNCLAAAFPSTDNWTLVTDINNKCDFLKDTCAAVIAVSDNDQQISIAFRGTTTAGQLLLEGLDSIAPEIAFNGLGMVNQYFEDGLNDVWPTINQTLAAQNTKNYVVVFTGHSLGGALASLAAAQTVKLGFRTSDQVKLITFGQPRVGDSTFAFNHDQLVPYSFRVVHQADIVPHVPKCKQDSNNGTCLNSLKSYYHHGTEVWYPSDMGVGAKYIVCTGQPTDEDISCSDGLHDAAGYSTSDHSVYFDQDVWDWGDAGCTDNANATTAPSSSEYLKLRNWVINHLQNILTG